MATSAAGAVYQQAYYEKNKDKIREKAREREKQKRMLAKTFAKGATPPKAESSSPNTEANRLQSLITAYAIPPLLLISSFLMIREMVNVYANTWGTLGAILIALAIEGFTLLFSFVHAPSIVQKISLRGLAVVLALGSIWGMSANHYATGVRSYRVDQVTERSIADLEAALNRKQVQSDALFAKNWTGAARKLEKQIDSMRMELTQLRNSISQMKPGIAVSSTTLFDIFIRFALTVCNLVAAHLFGASLKRIESFHAFLDVSKREIEISRPDNLKFLVLKKPLQKPIQEKFLKAFKGPFNYESG
jgi:hypothetical protein